MKAKIFKTTLDLIYISGFIYVFTFYINAIINK